MTCWQSFKSTGTHGDVIEQLNTASAEQISERRQYLQRIVSVITFLGKQNVPFRGHDEQETSNNQGNFLECMKLLKKFDPFLKKYSPPKNATYLSHPSQNEIISSIAQEITENITKQIRSSTMYSVMADEARYHHTERLAVCVRFVTMEGSPSEAFLGLHKLEKFDTKSIADGIEAVVQSHNLGDLKCVAQTYDGASVMSGAVGGVQAYFKERHPEAVYAHCYAHELNLVLCHTCKAIPEAAAFFDLLENIYPCFSNSLINHNKSIEIQNQLGLHPSELLQLSNTRWESQVRSVKAVMNNLPAILACLRTMKTATAQGILSNLCKPKTIYMLVMFAKLLMITECFHRYLQGENFRTSSSVEDLFKSAMTICEENHIQLPVGPRKKHKIMDDFVVESACGATSILTTPDEFRRQLLYPCLDRMIQELTHRFSDLGEELMSGIQACNPTTSTFLSEEALKGLANHYGIKLMQEELLVAKHVVKKWLEKERDKTTPDTATEENQRLDIATVFRILDREMFPTLKAVLQVALTIPISSCNCERSFSVLRRLHTWLRSTMDQERLNDLFIMSIEKETLDVITPEQIIDRFAKLKPRRHSLILLPLQKKVGEKDGDGEVWGH
nr:zinc finger MYM-type protein 1-like [Nothobranchius furzeri]